jgi:signal transduction histidine kinase
VPLSSTPSDPHQSRRGQIFRRYARAIVGVVAGVLLLSSSLNIYFSYNRIKAELSRFQQEKARSAASTVSTFIDQIRTQMNAASREIALDSTPQQMRDSLRRTLQLAQQITEMAYVASDGREQLAVSRLETDRLLPGMDRSGEEAFARARPEGLWFSTAFFESESEPHMAVSAGLPASVGGALIADVNLTFVQEVVLGLELERGGYAFVVDPNGLLIAHPDLSLVLRKTDLQSLSHVREALSEQRSSSEARTVSKSLGNDPVFSAYHSVAQTGWLVFVEQPTSQAFSRLREHLIRTVAVFALGLFLAVLTSVVLARRLTRPVDELHRAAAAIGGGDLGVEIDVRTGDELQDLGQEFDRMRLQLRARLEELRASRRRLVRAQDEERRKMERDIHDGAQQQLVSLSVKLGLVKNLLSRDPEKAAGLLDDVMGENSDALETLRDLARGLYPPALRDHGLAAAVSSHIGRLPADVSFDDGGLRGVRFPQEIEGQVYFCIREALQNATKYAAGSPVHVRLAVIDGEIEFAIADEGPGFDVEKVRRGAGLQNISDRLEALGGRLVISSSEGQGSSVGGRIPLPQVVESTGESSRARSDSS